MTIEIKELIIQARIPDRDPPTVINPSARSLEDIEARWVERMCRRIKEELLDELRGHR